MAKILWKNEFFEIDEDGIEWIRNGRRFGYYIHGSRLLEETHRGDVKYYDWPIHLAETKRHFPMDEFEEAFRKALILLAAKYEGEPDMTKVDKSFRDARKIMDLDGSRGWRRTA